MNKLTAEKCREQFEEWLTSLPGFELNDLQKHDNGKYIYKETEWCWKSWQASRDNLEIALPVLEQQGVIGKPVAWLNDAYLARGVVDGEAGEDDAGPGYIPVYRHPQNATPQTKTDTYRQIENDGREG